VEDCEIYSSYDFEIFSSPGLLVVDSVVVEVSIVLIRDLVAHYENR
jgi:hypothetical protein